MPEGRRSAGHSSPVNDNDNDNDNDNEVEVDIDINVNNGESGENGGGEEEMVEICHNGQTLNLSPSGAIAHLQEHPGDTIGPCPEPVVVAPEVVETVAPDEPQITEEPVVVEPTPVVEPATEPVVEPVVEPAPEAEGTPEAPPAE